MRQAMNFRFNTKTVTTLLQLEDELNLSKTAILEQALQYYAKVKLSTHQPLLELAGKLSSKQADNMLKAIKSARKNKKKDITL